MVTGLVVVTTVHGHGPVSNVRHPQFMNMSSGTKVATCGPGYATPLAAMKGPREGLIYIVCIQPKADSTKKCDYLATVDVDPKSPTYCRVIHRTYTTQPADELHHTGWNVCSSCHGDRCNKLIRDKLIMPCLGSDRIYVVDTGTKPRAPELHKVINAAEMHNFDCATPHTSHCLATGEIMISTMGDVQGNGKGDFILVDAEELEVKGTWTKGNVAKFGYDFWYQPYWDVMVATEWGTPRVFKQGFHPSDTMADYGHSLNFYSWSERKLIQTIDLGVEGLAPLEVRFLHDPLASEGYVGCCVNANVFRFYRTDDGKWKTQKVIDIPGKKVSGWAAGDYIQGMVTDILLSLDDKYLYLSNWLHGDVRQYDITDKEHPKLTGQVFLGGLVLSDSKLVVLKDTELEKQPDPVYIKDRRLYGSPQMLQLSLDGKRLYVSSSLFSPWDKLFYPDTVEEGSWIVKLDVDVENGGMKMDSDFFVDFGKEPEGPVFAHEMRYPGGDCTSDIWLAPK